MYTYMYVCVYIFICVYVDDIHVHGIFGEKEALLGDTYMFMYTCVFVLHIEFFT